MERIEFERTIVPLRPRIVEFAARMTHSLDDADDIAQETMLKLWSMRHRLDGYASVAALAMTIARNKTIDRLRKPALNVELDCASTLADSRLDPSQMIEDAEADAEASDLLARLPEQMRTILTMRHVDGLDNSEIAALTGNREATVRVTLCRARRRIRELFSRQQN